MALPDELANGPNRDPGAQIQYQNGPDGSGDLRDFSDIAHNLPASAEQVRETLRDLGEAARDKVDRARISTAQNLESAAGAVREGGHRMPSRRMENVADSTAERMDAAAGTLRRNDLGSVLNRAGNWLTATVKDNPGPALAAATVLGFLAGRAIAGASRR